MFDLHVHTEASAPYLKGDARLAPYHARGKACHLAFMGISDHYHYVWQATRYVRLQRAHVDAVRYEDPRVFIGVEQTILGDKGQVGIRASGREALHYIILAIHWMSIGGRLGREAVAALLQSHAKRVKIVDTAKRYYRGAIANPRLAGIPKVIGHPFNFLTNHHPLFPELLDAVDWLCKLCADNHVAYEVNLDSVPGDVRNPNDRQDAFWRHLAASLNTHGTLVSLGSDAHKMGSIGNVGPAIECMSRYGCKPRLLLDQAFIDEGKR